MDCAARPEPLSEILVGCVIVRVLACVKSTGVLDRRFLPTPTVHIAMNIVHSAGMRALPPFDGLIAFDAALRHRSMTRAAGELGLTQSAISHRLKKLEGFVGARLLDRTGGGLLPTAAGVTLAEGTRAAARRDGRATRPLACGGAAADTQDRTGLGPCELLAGAASDGVCVRLSRYCDRTLHHRKRCSGARPRSRRADPVDSQSRRARHIDPAPAFRRDGFSGGDPAPCCRAGGHCGSRTYSALYQYCTRASPAGTTARNGRGRCGSNGWASRLPFQAGLRFDNLGTAITAALQGSGVVLARSLLVHDALAEKRLCRVVSPDWDMTSSKAHVIRWPAALTSDRRVARFADWVVREAAQTSLQ